METSLNEAAEARRFDFLHGRWDVRHRKLKERLAGSVEWFEFPGTLEVGPLLGGLGNFDHNVLFDPDGRIEASSLRLYNVAADTWSIWWILARSAAIEYPVTGRFDGKKGTFFGEEPFQNRLVPVRTTYEPLAPDRAQWTQAYSPDKGATWEVNWIMDFTQN